MNDENSGVDVDDPRGAGGVLDPPTGQESNHVTAPITAPVPNGKTAEKVTRGARELESPSPFIHALPDEPDRRSTLAMLMAAAYIVGGSYAVIFGARVLWAELHKEK